VGSRSAARLGFLWPCERLHSVLSGNYDGAPDCRRTEPLRGRALLLVPGPVRAAVRC
jgi:hypothetical protein